MGMGGGNGWEWVVGMGGDGWLVGWLVGGVSFDIPVRCTGGLSCRRCCKYLLYLLLLIFWIILFSYFVFYFCISHFTFHV